MVIYVLVFTVIAVGWLLKGRIVRSLHAQKLQKNIRKRFQVLNENEQLKIIAAIFGKEISDNKARFNSLLSDPYYTVTPEDSWKSQEIINEARELILKARESSPLTVFIECLQSEKVAAQIEDYFDNRAKYSEILETEMSRYS